MSMFAVLPTRAAKHMLWRLIANFPFALLQLFLHRLRAWCRLRMWLLSTSVRNC